MPESEVGDGAVEVAVITPRRPTDPVLSADEQTVFASSDKRTIHALSAHTGERLWEHRVPAAFRSTPVGSKALRVQVLAQKHANVPFIVGTCGPHLSGVCGLQ